MPFTQVRNGSGKFEVMTGPGERARFRRVEGEKGNVKTATGRSEARRQVARNIVSENDCRISFLDG